MFLSDLQNKDVISVKDGRVLGHIIDAKIDDNGKIISLSVEPRKGIKIFMSTSEVSIPFTSIEKIGSDVILVNM